MEFVGLLDVWEDKDGLLVLVVVVVVVVFDPSSRLLLLVLRIEKGVVCFRLKESKFPPPCLICLPAT